ncbi:MAG: hypothetical protein V4598_03975 [Bdellovibrionota bacterium]
METLPDSPVILPSHAMIRFSGAWWKTREWPDVLGITIRLSKRKINSTNAGPDDQDLLLASFRRPWEMFIAPFTTEHHDFQENSYYAISPFTINLGTIVDIMVEPTSGSRTSGTREEKLTGNVLAGNVVLRVLMKERKKKGWRMIARIRVMEEMYLDQEALRFHPFQANELRPYGFLQYLRYGPYKMSQWVRPGKEVSGEEMTTD